VKKLLGLALAVALMAAGAAVYAFAATKTYQVTGPVLEVRSDAVVVQKGAEKWEIARDSGTKVTGDLKVGAKVTVMYRMTATDVEVKPEPAAKGKKKSGN
jgi:heme/copper-type cytochrome/quinol oxidase subunit 2